jgi:hypothetical protein
MDVEKKLQPFRRSGPIIICKCGGRIYLYADSLGTCRRCKNDFFVDFHKGARRIQYLVDHRRDLT